MDTYINFSDGTVKVGKSSLIGVEEQVLREIIESVSCEDGGVSISFKPLNDADFERLTKCFDNPVKYGEESYIVEIDDIITIYYTAEITKLYALYAIKRHYNRDGIKKGVIYNTPKVPLRCYRCFLPAKDKIDEFKKIVDMLIAYGHNAIMPEIGGAMEYKRHPEINEGWIEYCKNFKGDEQKGRLATKIMHYPKTSIHSENASGDYLTYEELAEIVDYCSERHMEIIPEVPSLSHSEYILYKHPELAEAAEGDPIPNTACPLNEEYQAIILDVLDEVVEVFRPKRVNICHDEIYVIGECPKCKKEDANKLFADDVTRMYNHLAAKGVKTMMWGDGLLGARGCEAYHQRFPWDGKSLVEIDGKKYKPYSYRWCSMEEWAKIKEENPDAEGWHVPRKQDAIKYIPKDIEVINWYWMWYTPGDDEFKENGIEYSYGNFLATGVQNFEERVKKGVKGIIASNWGGVSIEEAQRVNGLFCIGYNSLACWCEYYDETKREEYIMKVANDIYKYMNHDTLMKKHLEITHTTEELMEHIFFFYGVYFDIRERFRMGDYEIVYTDGTSEKLPIYWGYNIGNSNIGWGTETEGYTVAVGNGNYCIPYVFETIGASLPVRDGEKTWHRLVVPTDKDVASVTFKALNGHNVEVKEWAVK